MNRTQVIALALGLSVVATGCDDEFLTTVPPDQVSDVVFWQQEKDAVLAVNALYPLNQGERLVIRMEAASDNAWAQKSFDGWYPIGQGVVDTRNGTTAGAWYDSYRAIRRANEILANIDKIPTINANLKTRLVGETHFHRAFHYNILVNLFGDVPLLLTPISIEEGEGATRTPRAQVVDQILKDLDIAIAALPNEFWATSTSNRYPNSEAGRATKGAALALKARAALYAGRWAVAEEAAKAVMDLGVYSLHPNYADLTHYAGDNSREIIYADRRAAGIRGHGAFGWLGPRSLQGGSDITPLRELVDSYQMRDGQPMGQSPLFSAANPYANRDPRMAATLLVPGGSYCGTTFNSLPGSKTPDEVRNDFNATSTGFQFIKYVDCTDRNDRGNSGIDFIFIRYADVLLMYAEAKIEQNELDQSVYDAINAVRTRAGMPPITGGKSQAELRAAVRYERRAEFAMEGLRTFDIRRWKIAEQVMNGQTYGIDYVDGGVTKKWVADARRFDAGRDYFWPIPQGEIDLNPGLAQNPGY